MPVDTGTNDFVCGELHTTAEEFLRWFHRGELPGRQQHPGYDRSEQPFHDCFGANRSGHRPLPDAQEIAAVTFAALLSIPF